MFTRDNFNYSNQAYSEMYNPGLINGGLFNEQAYTKYSPPVLDNSFTTPPTNTLPYCDFPLANVNYLNWETFGGLLSSPRLSNLEFIKNDLSPLIGEFPHGQPQENTIFFPSVKNLTADSSLSTNNSFSKNFCNNPIGNDLFGLFARQTRLNQAYATLPPRTLGLPATSHLAPGVNVPRCKPTLLSRDPTQPILYCKFCLQPFSRRNSLRRHEQLHTGLKPYMCHPCGRSFSRQDIFKRHCASRRCMRLTQEESWNNSR